ncbi:MAG: Vms1/Ankzf1 family peptidyl-tRNA hydrolase [Candidatus Limnocylindria bacterium]
MTTPPHTPTIPPTSELGPQAERRRATMRRVAEAEPDEVLILSAYVDIRPEAHGERPAARAELIELRHRLDDAIHEHEPAHSPARVSLEADRRRLEAALESDDARQAEGIAVFAADGIGLWEVVASAQPFETDVAAGGIGDLYALACQADAGEPAVIALADSHVCRLFTWQGGSLEELPRLDEPTEEHQRHDQGGWAQARYQRHIDEQDRRFASRAADAMARLAERERASAIVLGADERTSGVVLGELPERTRALVTDVLHIGMRAGRDEIEAEVGPLLAALAERRAEDAADRSVAGHNAGELGVLGIAPVRAALASGAVAELVFEPSAAAGMDRWDRAALVRQAVLTDARVVAAHDHAELRRHDGVGATLRFRA